MPSVQSIRLFGQTLSTWIEANHKVRSNEQDSEAEMTITLQDLQVLNEKATQGEWFVDEENLGERLIPGSNRVSFMGDICIQHCLKADISFIAALVNYYRSGALQRLAELAEDGERYRWLCSNALDDAGDGTLTITCELNIEGNQPAEIDAAIDTARAPSVKEQKRG
jgi:hypothetical protein